MNLRYTTQDKGKEKGMGLSIDAMFALILFVALLTFLSLQPLQERPLTAPKIVINQMIDDAITTLDSTGFMMNAIETSPDYNTLRDTIAAQVDSLLPDSISYKLRFNRYDANLSTACRTTRDFNTCFPPGPENPRTLFDTNAVIPTNKDIFHGQKIFVKKEPGDCEMVAGLEASKIKELIAYFAGNQAPEARDVNITTEGSCPGVSSPCPSAEDTLRCCYNYYDEDSDPEADREFRWYKFDSSANTWVLAAETGQTVGPASTEDSDRWKCSVRVNDGSQWSKDSNSPVAIIGGPCFVFSSGVSPTPVQCNVSSTANISITADAGERTKPIDIMLIIDRSGSMSWSGRYGISETARDIFVESGAVTDTAFLGSSSRVYKLDVNKQIGRFTFGSSENVKDDALGVYADAGYVLVADEDDGMSIIDKPPMSYIRSITNMTRSRDIFALGNYAYLAARGTPTVGTTKLYDASMSGSRNDSERVGYSSSRDWVAQSFKPGITDINGVSLDLQRYGNPGDLTVHIRSAIDGADLPNGTATINASDIPTSYTWIDVNFPANVEVTAGNTYYIVLTTTGISSSDYYRWGSRNTWFSDPYPDGKLYRCTSSDVCTVRDWSTQWGTEDARFGIYYFGEMAGGLVIVNKSDADPNNWFVEGHLYNTGSGLIDEPNAVFVEGNYAYIADTGTGDGFDGLWIVDVSNKANPTMAGFVSTSDAYGVSVSGNYAYVADRSDGLHIIDVSDKANPFIVTTLNTLGATKDVFVYDSNAYVIADTGSGATADGLHVIDIRTPAAASLTVTFDSPYNFYRLFVEGDYAFMSSNMGVISMDRKAGPKINSARRVVKEFVLYPDWESPEDRLGLASYGNGTSTLDHQLADATTANKASIATAIDGILAQGGTPMHLGLEEGLDELLLSGRGREDAAQFIILLADGQSDSGTQSQIDTQVARARDNNVYIFTVGLGGDVDEVQMQNIASGAYCPDPPTDCGTYHHVDDPKALSEIYEIIAKQINALAGVKPDKDTARLEMQFTRFSGLQLSSFNPAPTSWDGTTLVYEGLDIISGTWTADFDVLIPCNYPGCEDELVEGASLLIPPEGAMLSFTIEGVEQDPVEWPEKDRTEAEVHYPDLTVGFIKGRMYSDGDISLDYEVENIGYTAIDLSAIVPTLDFNYNPGSPKDPLAACAGDGVVIDTENLTAVLDAAFGPGAGPTTKTQENKELSQNGYICISLNGQQQGVKECSGNNRVVVFCKVPESKIYVLDYWAWEK